MKYSLLAILAILFSLQGLAQDTTLNKTPNYQFNESDYGFMMHVNGLILNTQLNAPQNNGTPTLFMRYALKNDVVLRGGLGFNIYRNRSFSTDSVVNAQVDVDSTIRQNRVLVGFGVEKHLSRTNRLDPYVGAQLNLGLIGRKNTQANTISVDTIGTASVVYNREDAGGFAIGVDLIAGFNYFIAKNLAVGAEYNFGFNNSLLGGDFSASTVSTPVSGQPVSTREVGANRTVSTTFNTQSNVFITLSYFISR